MKKFIIIFCLSFFVSFVHSQVNMSYYLPSNVSYNTTIPTPKEVLGYYPGEWHVSHDQLIYYMRMLAQSSERIKIEEYAKTHENRPLMQLIITSTDNHTRLDDIKEEHAKLSDPSSNNINISNMPIVIWLGYSVHGNEASGSNASLLVAYHLVAAQGKEIEELLTNAVVILDPSFNPDGLNRFASWVNTHRSHIINPDPNDREYNEAWPNGRTNHYWFDLNRDWLPVQHPESKGRIKRFHEWKPNILTDHHEMGTNATFFFQPGIPSRKYPWTPEKNVDLTQKMAKFHAKYLDDIGSLYYSRESFDDFYIGKGSTYPDVNGSVGILFEQASSRGHAQENVFGILTFHKGIKNHFTTSLSTLSSGLAYKDEFLNYQRKFYLDAQSLANKDPIKAYVFGSSKDKIKNYELLKILDQHQIEVYKLKQTLNKNGKRFEPQSAYIVPLNQPQYRLIKGIFETRTVFNDSLFYDVSSWTIPLAFNIDYTTLGKESNNLLDKKAVIKQPTGKVIGEKGAYAYAIEPYGYHAARAIHRLLNKGIIAYVLHEKHTTKDKIYPAGTVFVPIGVQEQKRKLIESTIDNIAKNDAIDIYALTTGLAVSGVDLGSRSMSVLTQPKVAVLVGEGISGYEAGEVWHLMDQRLKMKITLLPINHINKGNLSRYNCIVLPNGNYNTIGEKGIENLKKWIADGGNVIAWKNAGKWLSNKKITKTKYQTTPKNNQKKYKKYSLLEENQGAQITGGTIFQVDIDLTHPLAYGMTNNKMPVFRNHNLVMEKSENEYANPFVYTSNPLLSGYVSKENLERFKNSPAITVSSVGKGKVVTLIDNPNFRAFWLGTNKIFMNALFFTPTINSRAGE